MKHIIAPSLLSADAACWGRELELIESEGIQCLHLDVMDGQFVPNISFGPGPIKMLRPHTKMEFDAHLMVHEPAHLIPAFIDAGVDGITVHAEACLHLHKTLQTIKDAGVKVGVALNPATPVEMIEPVLEMLDRVLVMFVNPGFGGQKAIMMVMKKLQRLARMKKEGLGDYQLQVDGGLHGGNLTDFMDGGAECLVLGSALFQPDKTAENIRIFHGILRDHEKNHS